MLTKTTINGSVKNSWKCRFEGSVSNNSETLYTFLASGGSVIRIFFSKKLFSINRRWITSSRLFIKSQISSRKHLKSKEYLDAIQNSNRIRLFGPKEKSILYDAKYRKYVFKI